MKTAITDPIEERVLVLAPVGRDAELAAALLIEAGMQVEICSDVSEILARLREPCGAVLVAEEALVPGAMPEFNAILKHQPPWSDIPIVLLTSGGSVTHTSARAVALFGEHGNVTLLERPLRVITLRSTMQVALRARRRQYEVRNLIRERDQVLASIHDSFCILDREWRYTYVNEQTCALLQKSRKELIGAKMWELFPNTLGSELERNLREAMRNRTSMLFEWHDPRRNRWFSIRVYPTHGGISILTTDVTERKAIEGILKESERRLHLALETSQLGMFYCDLPFDRIIWDANCKRHFGLPMDAEVDFPLFYSLLHPDDREPTRLSIERSVAERENYDVEYRAIHPDGSVHWIRAIGRAFYNDSGEPFRFDGITIDISDRKQVELELERARKEAIEANRAKDHFLAALSHELRTPLTPVLMTVAALQQDPELPENLRADLEVVQRNVQLEARLIDDLLDLTRITRGKLILQAEVIDLHDLIDRAVETCRTGEFTRKRLDLRVLKEADEHHTFGDPARLQQILCNLLNNAGKFTPAGGRIEIKTENHGAGRIEISVRDTGIGIDADALPHLFDAFQQGDITITRRYGGLGLGLAISKTLADLHGGTMRAISLGRGHGATFVLELSTAVAPATQESVVHAGSGTGEMRPLHILLVEDHEATRGALTRLLTKAGHHVQSAGTVADGLQLASEHSFDLLVSDLGLPDASGLELMHELRGRYRLPGIALSGYGMEEDVRASAAAGFQAHLTKPVDWRRLEETLRKVAAARDA